MKVKDLQLTPVTTSPEPRSTPATPAPSIPEPQKLSVANILIHNAKTKDLPLKGTKPVKDKGGKKNKEAKKKNATGK